MNDSYKHKMIKTSLLILLLSGCTAGGSESAQSEPEPVAMTETEISFTVREKANGHTEQLNDNSWIFTGHEDPEFEAEFGKDCESHYCKKSDAHFSTQGWQSGRIEKHTFDFTLVRYNYVDSPFHIIVWQDWIRWSEDPSTNAKHPISTLDLRPVTGGVRLVHHDNAWMWDFSASDPYDYRDPNETKHQHPYKRMNGYLDIEKDVTYKIEIIIEHGASPKDGVFKFIVDGMVISQSFYQVRSENANGAIQFGLYWFRFYNTDLNGCERRNREPEINCKSNGVKIENYQVFES